MPGFKIEMLDNSKQCWFVNDYAAIGTDPANNIRLNAEKIESRHARLEIQDGKLVAKDLRSRSGITVNGSRIIEAVLADGDVLQVGDFEMVVHDLGKQLRDFPVVSRCEHWSDQLKSLAAVAQTQFPILLLGPSGSGKDVLAQALHGASNNASSSFLSVNCSALTETLIESELFGHVKGSFTGAISDRKGAFESARNGSLFLDEIGDLPYSLQAKLLRALENNEIRPVGSDRTIKTNVRIFAATHQNLYQKIREGNFRADLFYRLNVITVEVPALADRLEDFEDFLYQFARKMKVRFSHNAIQLLKKHEWPGNIRELRNVVARASALYPKILIEERHIDLLLNRKEKLAHAATGVNYAHTTDQAHMPVIKEIEKQMILKRLAANQGNQKRTATDLGMPKSTLHDRIRNYNISVEQFRV